MRSTDPDEQRWARYELDVARADEVWWEELEAGDQSWPDEFADGYPMPA